MNVIHFFRAICISCFRKGSTVILAFFWILGLLTGAFLSCVVSDSVAKLMSGCVNGSVSIVTLTQAYMLPFLCSALAVFLSSPWMVYAICFGKALVFSFVFCALTFAWGTSASFVRWMVLACDIFSLPLLYFWWLRSISGTRRIHLWELAAFSLPVVAIATAVYIWIIPFVADVLIL